MRRGIQSVPGKFSSKEVAIVTGPVKIFLLTQAFFYENQNYDFREKFWENNWHISFLATDY